MPGGWKLKLAPLLLTLAFMLPTTTGALPVADEVPWGAWYTEQATNELAISVETAIGVTSNGEPVAAFLSVNPATGKATLAFVERINGQWTLTWPVPDRHSHGPDIVVGPDDAIHMTYDEGRVDNGNQDFNYSVRRNGVWTTETILDGQNSAGLHSPLDLDSRGQPHIVYGTGCCPTTIHHAYKDTNGWHHETVATAEGSRYDLAVDALGQVHIVYQNGPSGLRHALRDTSGTWTTSPLLTQCAGDPTIDTDTTNTPHIACRSSTHGLVYYTQQNGQWVHEVVDNGCEADPVLCRATYESGFDPSLQADGQDRPHIVYRYAHVFDGTEPIWQTHPLYAVKVDGVWQVEVIDRDGWHHGYQPDIELDADGVPHVVFVTGWETVPAGTKGVNRAVYATPVLPALTGGLG